MLSRLPIPLAQLKAGNNSEKLKNEIRQLFYSLYRSKKLTESIYKSYLNIETIFMNTKIVRQLSLTNLFINLLTNLIFKSQITKALDWLI